MKGKMQTAIWALAAVCACCLWSCGVKDTGSGIPGSSTADSGAAGNSAVETEEDGAESVSESQQTDGQSAKEGAAEELRIPQMKPEEFPRVDGSTATLPLTQGLYRLTTDGSEEEALEAVVHTKTTNAYYQLMNGKTDLVVAYEAPESFFEDAREQGVELEIKPIGKDALVFLANVGNPVSSLTQAQLVDIYSGKLTNWSQVGGEDQEIVAFQRPPGSGSQTLMEKLVMGQTPMEEAPMDQIQSEMGELIDAVASYKNEQNAMGYSVYFYARNMYAQPDLKFMAVDEVLPDNETIRSGQYPYVNEFYAAVRKDESEGTRARELFDWLTADEGQAFIESLGYVSVTAPEQTFPALQAEAGEKGQLELAEGAALLLDGSLISENEGIVQVKADGSSYWLTKDYGLYGKQPLVVEPGEPFLVEDLEGGKSGVRDISGREIIPAEYDWIAERTGGGYRAALDSKTLFFDGQGKKLLEAGGDGKMVAEADDCLWEIDLASGQAVIYDWNGRQTGSVSLETYGTVQYAYDKGNGLIYVSFKEERPDVLFRPDGSLYFDPASIPDSVWESVGDGWKRETVQVQCPGEGRLVGLSNWDETVLYDIENKCLISQPGDLVYYYDYEDAFHLTRNGRKSLLDSNGETLTDEQGNPMEYVAGEGIYYRVKTGLGQEPGEVVIGDGRGAFQYRLKAPFQWNVTADAVNDYLFLVSDEGADRSYLFAGEEMVLETADSSLWATELPGGWIELYSFGTGTRIYNSQGGLEAELGQEDSLILADEAAIVTLEGNYIYVRDHQQRTAARFLYGPYWED